MSGKTQPVRVPEGMHGPLKTLSAALGQTPGALLHQAFNEYVQSHKDEFVAVFQSAQKYIASVDVEGLTDLLTVSRRRRAAAAASAIRKMRT